MKGRLFVCATPIGNLEDTSARLIRVLGEVDLVAAEDTRRTRKLLSHFGLHARVVSYHDANEREQTKRLAEVLSGGDKVALVTDAGMPAISDPGYRLVRACIDLDVPVEVIPGPSALLPALVLSGLPTHRFAFEGFLPAKGQQRMRRLESLKDESRTMVFYEAPNRLHATAADMYTVWGDRPAALARELTKVHEEVVRANLKDLVHILSSKEILGECVLVVGGATEEVAPLEVAVEKAKALEQSGMSKSKAAAAAATASGLAKAQIYERLIKGEGS